MSALGFFNNCLDLFSGALSAVLGQPVLSVFAGVALALALVAVVGFTVRSLRKM